MLSQTELQYSGTRLSENKETLTSAYHQSDMKDTGQSNPSLLPQGSGVRQLTPWQNTENLQQNVAVDKKVLELLLQNLHTIQKENKDLKDRFVNLEQKVSVNERRVTPTTSKEPVMRTKSAPESYQKIQDMRKASSPKIFLFPEMKQRTDRYASDNKSQGSSLVSADGASGSSEGPSSFTSDRSSSSSDRSSSEFLSLRDCSQEPPGVSSQYFNNVINELVKTKNNLHSLQMKQKTQNDSSSSGKENKMRQEMQQLRLFIQQLQRDLHEKDEVIAQLERAHVKDDSFELSSESETAEKSKTDSDPSSQGSTEAEIQRLREEVEELTNQNQLIKDEKEELESILLKDKNDINRELMEKKEAYERLRENVKILSKCLQEEKARCKNIDEKLRVKTDDTRKISAHLGSLRQQYEELRQEKNALEKTLSLEDYPSMRYSSPGNRTMSGGSNRSGEMPRFGSNRSNNSSNNSRSGNYNIQPENKLSRVSQNNLSSGKYELKPSNLPQLDAIASLSYKCPRCYKICESEPSYQIHLNSCIE